MTTTTQDTLTADTLTFLALSPPGNPADWAAYWAMAKDLRARGWKPSAQAQAQLDAAFKAGKAAGLAAVTVRTVEPKAREAARVQKARTTRFLRKQARQGNHATVAVVAQANGKTRRVFHKGFPGTPEAFRNLDAHLKALRAQAAAAGITKGTLRVTVKDWLNRETFQATYDVGSETPRFAMTGSLAKAKPAAKPEATKAAQARNKAAHVLAPKAKPAPVPSGNDAVKTALGAALQGLNAAASAIQAAIAAL